MPTAREAYILRALRRNRIAASMRKFNQYVSSPFDMGGGAFVMPDDARVAVSFDAEIENAGDVVVTVAGKEFRLPAMPADTSYRINAYVRKGRSIDATAESVAGGLSLYVLDQWMRPRLIANKTFSV
jgi:hypothetical protein